MNSSRRSVSTIRVSSRLLRVFVFKYVYVYKSVFTLFPTSLNSSRRSLSTIRVFPGSFLCVCVFFKHSYICIQTALYISLELTRHAVNVAGAAEEGEQRDGSGRGSRVRDQRLQHDGDATHPAQDPRRRSGER